MSIETLGRLVQAKRDFVNRIKEADASVLYPRGELSPEQLEKGKREAVIWALLDDVNIKGLSELVGHLYDNWYSPNDMAFYQPDCSSSINRHVGEQLLVLAKAHIAHKQSFDPKPILPVTHEKFAEYGAVLTGESHFLLDYMGSAYVPDKKGDVKLIERIATILNPGGERGKIEYTPKLVNPDGKGLIQPANEDNETDYQIGVCIFHNGIVGEDDGKYKVSTAEFHPEGVEYLLALEDCILIVGKPVDVNNPPAEIDSYKDFDTFYMRKGEEVVLHNGVLHWAPNSVFESGSAAIVALPLGTNLPFENQEALYKVIVNRPNLVDVLVMQNKAVYTTEGTFETKYGDGTTTMLNVGRIAGPNPERL